MPSSLDRARAVLDDAYQQARRAGDSEAHAPVAVRSGVADVFRPELQDVGAVQFLLRSGGPVR